MTGDILLVFGLLAATVLLFVSNRLRLDVVALLSLLALASAAAFAVGAALPVLTTFLVPRSAVLVTVGAATVLTLLLLGALAAYAGGAPLLRGALRVALWGVLAMAATAVVGTLVGVAL